MLRYSICSTRHRNRFAEPVPGATYLSTCLAGCCLGWPRHLMYTFSTHTYFTYWLICYDMPLITRMHASPSGQLYHLVEHLLHVINRSMGSALLGEQLIIVTLWRARYSNGFRYIQQLRYYYLPSHLAAYEPILHAVLFPVGTRLSSSWWMNWLLIHDCNIQASIRQDAENKKQDIKGGAGGVRGFCLHAYAYIESNNITYTCT